VKKTRQIKNDEVLVLIAEALVLIAPEPKGLQGILLRRGPVISTGLQPRPQQTVDGL
jgi:hypothetical protein